MSALASVAAWLQPVLVAALAFRVAAGTPDAPWLGLAALVAPLVALLAGARPAARNPVTAIVATVTVGLVLAADLLVAADAATVLGAARWQGVVPAALAMLVMAMWAPARRLSPPAVAVAAVVLLLGSGAVALAAGAPWTAWHRSGVLPALTFPAQSSWVLGGQRFARATTLRFAEGQRVVTLAAGVYRVVERDAATPTVREWRLAAGDALTLRPGDELSVEAGAHVRFEAGRRVPGAPASGVAWADASARGPRLLPLALGGLVTMLGGAMALVPPSRRGRAAAAGPLVLLAATSAALAWGVYAAGVPDLVLSGALPAPLLRLPTVALGGAAGVPLALLTGGALLVLLVAAAVALRERLAAAASAAPEVWAAVVVAATAVAVWPIDPWRVLVLALGLAAAAWAPARVATSSAGALAGPIVGGVAFVAVAALPAVAPGAPAWLEALTRYPALVALPLGWLAARAMPPDGPRAATGG